MTLLLLLFGIAIKIVLPIVAIIFLIKGIKYLNQKNKDSKENWTTGRKTDNQSFFFCTWKCTFKRWKIDLTLPRKSSTIREPRRSKAPNPIIVPIHSPKERLSNMNELLTAASAAWQVFYDGCIKGLINFDNPLLSLTDYILWAKLAISAIKRLLRKRWFYRR